MGFKCMLFNWEFRWHTVQNRYYVSGYEFTYYSIDYMNVVAVLTFSTVGKGKTVRYWWLWVARV